MKKASQAATSPTIPNEQERTLVVAGWLPRDEKQGRRFLRRNLWLHFRPPMVNARTLRFTFTWGLGGMAVVLVALQFFSGLLLKFVYDPTPVAAYDSIHYLIEAVPYGRLVRNIHHWCAHLVVLVAGLHLLRVFFTGACHRPRRVNWFIGMGQLMVILAANFTGYLLPWDQLAYWAVTVSSGMLAYVPLMGADLQFMLLSGSELGPTTLRAFFAMHTAVVPLLLLILMGLHFWRIRKVKGLVIPRAPEEELPEVPDRVSVWPHLILRETVTALVLVAVILFLAIFLDAPLGDPANPGLSPNPTKAPWYFAGFQELLLHMHPIFAICVLPLFFGLGLLLSPLLRMDDELSGVWFLSKKGRRTAVLAALTALVAAPGFILLDTWVLPPMESLITGGLLPFLVLMAVLTGLYGLLVRYFNTGQGEAIQALFVFLGMGFLIFMVTNVWFRGEGMALVWPW